MSGKRYDLAQVSQVTKDEYLQSMMDWHMHKTTSPQVSSAALDKLYLEAEVKPPKTAREILQKYLDRPLEVDREDELEMALEAIEQALKVLP